MENNYTVLHLHSDLSNGVTNIDSVTKYDEYVERAKELEMKAIAFSEHGSVFEWVKKKETVEKAGMKYIHAEEFYVTESLEEKIRDNKHVWLAAKNYNGVLELNKLSSKAFNREDGHFYFVPRITIDELIDTSDNIIVSTACLGGILADDECRMRDKFLPFLIQNKHRCFLEIQHHNVKDQKTYNQFLYKLHKDFDIPLIAMTDTHALNSEHLEGRSILQKSKNINFDNEEGWDLTFKSYEELVEAYKIQNGLPIEDVLEAIENTNKLADMVEDFELDRSYKYPHLWEDSEKLFREKINQGIINRGVDKFPNYQEYLDRIEYEMKAYIHNGAIDFMLLMEDIISWCRTQDIAIGYGRGSVNGSVIAWLIGITEMDSIKHKLNFDRFMNVERVSLSDIDTDFPPSRIDDVKNYIFNHHGLHCCDIITFNTIADKGAIRDVCRALYKVDLNNLPSNIKKKLDKYNELAKAYNGQGQSYPMDKDLKEYLDGHMKKTNEICDEFDKDEFNARMKYPEVFKLVDIVKGTIVSIGNHPCGMVCSPQTLDDNMGLCTTSTDPLAVSQIYMKEIDGLNYVKLDLLKLDTIELIANTCKLIGMPMLTPDNMNISEEEVWNSMREDTTSIFQWESATALDYIKRLLSDKNIENFKTLNPDVDRMTLLSIGNSAIRPAGASYRDDLANGVIRKSGSEAIDEFLKPTFGYLVFQCQIIEFLHSYCGFTMGEADIVRRHFAKKTGTDKDIPIIKDGGYMDDSKKHYIPGFVATMKDKYGMEREEAEETIVAFLQVIEDASAYLFSLNHSQPYSYEGYACGWLRYHYPLEFLTAVLNINKDKEEKTNACTQYAKKVGIKINPIKFGYSTADYSCDKKNNSIYKGIASIKFMNSTIAEELYALKDNHYPSVFELLLDLKNTSINSRQLDILVKLDFFEQFGSINYLLYAIDTFNKFYGKKNISKSKIDDDNLRTTIEKFASSETEKMFKFDEEHMNAMLKYLFINADVKECTLSDKIKYQIEHLGYIDYKNDSEDPRKILVMDLDTKYSPKFKAYCLKNGQTCEMRVSKKKNPKENNNTTFSEIPFENGDIIYMYKCDKRAKQRKVNDKWEIIPGEFNWWITKYKKI